MTVAPPESHPAIQRLLRVERETLGQLAETVEATEDAAARFGWFLRRSGAEPSYPSLRRRVRLLVRSVRQVEQTLGELRGMRAVVDEQRRAARPNESDDLPLQRFDNDAH